MAKPELLAPAGSILCFQAAFDAGADAFYLGTQDFNARKRAKNFPLEDVCDLIAFSHRHHRKVYLTLNTLVYENEIGPLLKLLEKLEAAQADAVIVQDLGVLHLVARHFPGLKIHASTQMFCHNSLHAQTLKELGVSRIVLPRELSFEEIKTLREKVPMEYEFFIHGALCFSFSGCCLASSHLFWKSGNRGECCQVCRFAYDKGDDSRHYPFSMRDLDSRDIFKKLLTLKPASFKIEGRLKNADYVFKTVSAYRRLIDEAATGKREKGESALMDRKGTCTGYFFTSSYDKLTHTDVPGNTGEPIGQVISCRMQEITARVTRPLKKGMRLRVQSPTGQNVVEETLIDFSTQRDRQGIIVTWQLRDRLEYRHNPEKLKLFLLGESRPGSPLPLIRKEASLHKSFPLHVQASWSDKEGFSLTAMSDRLDAPFKRSYSLPTETAKKTGALFGQLNKLLKETAAHPFAVHSVACDFPDTLFVPLSALKQTRRDFYDALAQEVEAMQEERNRTRQKAVMEDMADIRKRYDKKGKPGEFLYRREWNETDEDPSIVITDLRLSGPLPPKETLLLLPLFISEAQLVAWKERIQDLHQNGFRRFMAQSLGTLKLLSDFSNLSVYTGSYLYASNIFAFDLIRSFSVKGVALPADIADGMLLPLPTFKGTIRIKDWPMEMFMTRLRLPDRAYKTKDGFFRVDRFEEYDRVWFEKKVVVEKKTSLPTSSYGSAIGKVK
ncbi:MAG: hypothetical protein A2293_07940 [Elusimicrobia bacterium RIFOXYB2_FULL_49_7]|nr:MAG: hypothetical protein A2293_07940 [Elusimicrobia bacterium RIFOXYB2_FULL_49_7]